MPEPKTEVKKTDLEQAVEILKEHGMQESNIPLDSKYWKLMNDHRHSLRSK